MGGGLTPPPAYLQCGQTRVGEFGVLSKRIKRNSLASAHKSRVDSPDRRLPKGLSIEQFPLAYIEFDHDFLVLEWNPAAVRIFGYAKVEALGHSIMELIVPTPVTDHVKEVLLRIWTGDLEAHGVNENLTKDGRVLLCNWFNTPIRDADGKVTNVVSIGENVTTRICRDDKIPHNCPMRNPSYGERLVAENRKGPTHRTKEEIAMRGSADWLQHLSQRVRDVEDHDRQHLSREFQNEIDQLQLAIKAVSQSEPYLLSEASNVVIAGNKILNEPSLDRLTPRQREVLLLVVEGFRSKQIAKKLNISIKTVEMHRGHTMDVLDIHDIPGLVRYAIRVGLISADTEANN
jgi:PAS domain S-box-containing protein